MGTKVKIIKDSISHVGKRITTFELTYPRYIHSELMTHRQFSRNASSSRAIPFKKMVDQVISDPVIPSHWGINQRGMQADQEFPADEVENLEKEWLKARDAAVAHAQKLANAGLHKQIVNRILEPWMHITVIVTSTEWDNWYNLRTHKDAHPDIKLLADKMLEKHNESVPNPVEIRAWHLPFINADEEAKLSITDQLKCSVARCARVSYLNHDGSSPNVEKDFELYERLLVSKHMSPFEHQAQPLASLYVKSGNFAGWMQYRKIIDDECCVGFDMFKKEYLK